MTGFTALGYRDVIRRNPGVGDSRAQSVATGAIAWRAAQDATDVTGLALGILVRTAQGKSGAQVIEITACRNRFFGRVACNCLPACDQQCCRSANDNAQANFS
ncbi:MAG TPA: hypothetical protein PKC03_10610 [Dokdonella sp.]|nr:hypothetical protein [Dokdonella sp.]